MTPLVKFLHDLSYSKTALAKSCAFILLLGFAIAGITGSLLQWLLPEEDYEPDLIQNISLQYELARSPSFDFMDLPSLGTLFFPPEDKWLPVLKDAAGAKDPAQGKRFALGLWVQGEGRLPEAMNLFHEENRAYPHPLVREWEINTALRAKDVDAIRDLQQNPAYEEDIDGLFMFRLGVAVKNWPMIFRYFWDAQYRYLPLDTLLMALISGAVWTALIFSLFPKFLKSYGFMALGALALGWMSTWPTIWSDIWMDQQFGLNEGSDFISALLYFTISVGLREEVCKLLLFTPFLFRVLKQGRDLEALLFGALVGLGFAIEENINYFQSYQGSGVVVIRFVSANLLHLSLTAATSLALTRAVRDPQKWLADGVQLLAIAIGLHGLYNTLFSYPVPGFGDMSYFAGAVLAACSYLLFKELRSLAPMRGYKISRTGIFCWGFCLLLNLELLGAAALLPFNQALYYTGQAALSAVFIAYVFIHQIQEPLAP